MFKRLTTDYPPSFEGRYAENGVDIVREAIRDFVDTYVTRDKKVYKILNIYYCVEQQELMLILVCSVGREYFCNISEVDFNNPLLGYLNIGFNAIFLSKVPRRQWRKGLSTNTIKPSHPYEEEFSKVFGVNLVNVRGGLHRNIMGGFVHFPTYPTVAEAVDRLLHDNKTLSCALSIDYALCLHPITEKLYLHYRHAVESAEINEDGTIKHINEESLWLESSIKEVMYA